MKIDQILGSKGRDVVTIEGSKTVLEAIGVLVEHNIGGVVVVEGDRPVGILTERDILRLTAREAPLASTVVEDVMTRDLVTARPDDRLGAMMDVMTERKIRHLPVLDGERLAGIISIGDLVNASRLLAETENVHLKEYIRRG